MSEDTFPLRPRLANHVLARKHLVDGEERVVLHDTRAGGLLQIGLREWGLIAAADGTRDIEGIVLAAAREGAHARAPALLAFLEQLHAAGLLEEGAAPPLAPDAPAGRGAPVEAPDPSAAQRPLDVLPDFSLHCDGTGSCCRIYASVIFGPIDAARARSLLPMVMDGGVRHERAFLPEHGSAPTGGSAVALSDGRCAYLESGGRCALHAMGGASAKPLGCNLFPATLLDDGERVRVTASVECACVLQSVGRPGGAPLIPENAVVRGDLDEAIFIAALPAEAAVSPRARASRAALVSFFDRLAALPPPADVAAALWSLGEALDDGDLDARAIERFEHPSALEEGAVRPFIEALHGRASRREREDEAWRSKHDLARRATQWIALCTSTLLAPGALSSLFARPLEAPEGEAFYLRAGLHGLRFVGDLPLSIALRDRAARILTARALRAMFAGAPPDDPACAEPLALLEAMLRGHGLDAYAHDVAT